MSNMFQVMHFVDHASPQELQKMVQTRDPYSYMALAKMQELRDNALKAKANQPVAPPLAQTIPLQLEQLQQGIGALNPNQSVPLPAPQEQPAIPPFPGRPLSAWPLVVLLRLNKVERLMIR
jgi:hypothetical protein